MKGNLADVALQSLHGKLSRPPLLLTPSYGRRKNGRQYHFSTVVSSRKEASTCGLPTAAQPIKGCHNSTNEKPQHMGPPGLFQWTFLLRTALPTGPFSSTKQFSAPLFSGHADGFAVACMS